MNVLSEKYQKIGEEVKAELFPELKDIRIAWLASDEAKHGNGKTTYADCAKVSKRYDWACGDYDYIITVYEPNIDYFSEKQIRVLLEHELMHIKVTKDNRTVRPHDTEEFVEIIRKYGIDWSEPGMILD